MNPIHGDRRNSISDKRTVRRKWKFGDYVDGEWYQESDKPPTKPQTRRTARVGSFLLTSLANTRLLILSVDINSS